MPDRVVLNSEPYMFTIEDLPCLIHYEKGLGGSELSLALVAQLFTQGYKILFLCAYPQGEEKFMAQIGGAYDRVHFVNAKEDFPNAEKKQVVLLESGDYNLLFDAVDMLPDFKNRIIFVKNIETFPKVLIKKLLHSKHVILSGDVDEAGTKHILSTKDFATLIMFNKPKIPLRIKLPSLPKWSAFLSSQSKNGVIHISK